MCRYPSSLSYLAVQGKLALDKVFEGIKAAGLNGDISTDLAHAIWWVLQLAARKNGS